MMHYQDYVLGLLRSPCVCTCVPFSGLLFCLLMTTVFQTFCPFSLYSCLSLPSLPLSTSNLVPHPSVTSSLLPFLRCPTAHADSNTSLEHRLPFVSANQIFPKLSSLSCLSLFSLCVRDYVVMRVSCLQSKAFLTLLLLLSLSLSHVVTLSFCPLHLPSSCFINYKCTWLCVWARGDLLM